MDKYERIRLLEKLISDSNEVISLDKSDKEFVAWRSRVGSVLGRIFGRNSIEITKFRNLDFYSRESSMDDISEQKKTYIRDLAIARESIQSYIDEIRGVERSPEPEIIIEESSEMPPAKEEKEMKVITEVEIIPEVINGIEVEKNEKEETNIFVEEKAEEEFVVRRNENILNDKLYDIIVIGKSEIETNKTAVLFEKLKLNPIVFNKFSNEIFKNNASYLGIKSVIILYDKAEENQINKEKFIFAIGKLLGKFGDKNVILVHSEEVHVAEVFSEMKNIETDKRDRWFFDIAKELKGLGYRIDLNDLI